MKKKDWSSQYMTVIGIVLRIFAGFFGEIVASFKSIVPVC